MPIRITGMATGMDTESMIKQLMTAKRMPIDKMQQQKTSLTWQRDQYREMNTLMSQLREATSKLRFEGTMNPRKVTTDNANVTATATAAATKGAYSLTVHQVAKGAAIQGNAVAGTATDPLNTGGATTLTINGKDITFAQNSKAADVVNAINAETGTTGVRASFDAATKRFSLTNAKTGVNSKIDITHKSGDNSLLTNMNLPSTSVTGQNAVVDFNGSNGLSYETNSFTVENVTLQLKDSASATFPMNVSVSVEQDTGKQFDAIKNFVDKYNEVIEKINTKVTEQRYRDYGPLTDEQKKEMKENEVIEWEKRAKSGLLRNDSSLTSTLTKLRTDLRTPVTGLPAGNYDTLGDIGISTAAAGQTSSYKENGKLYIDEAKLKDALAANPDQVSDLFVKGFGERLYKSVDASMTRLSKLAGSEGSLVDSSTLGTKIYDLNKRIDIENSKLKDYEDRYYIQFSKMETAMNRMQEQQNWLAGQLGGL